MEYRERVQQRLVQLHEELTSGQGQLTNLEARVAELKQTLLRISGAIQVLEELEDKNQPA